MKSLVFSRWTLFCISPGYVPLRQKEESREDRSFVRSVTIFFLRGKRGRNHRKDAQGDHDMNTNSSKIAKIRNKIQRARMTISALEQTEESKERDIEISRLTGLINRWTKDLKLEGGEQKPDTSALAALLGAKVAAPALTIHPVDAIMVGEQTFAIYAETLATLIRDLDVSAFADQETYLASVAALVAAGLQHAADTITLAVVVHGPDSATRTTHNVAALLPTEEQTEEETETDN